MVKGEGRGGGISSILWERRGDYGPVLDVPLEIHIGIPRACSIWTLL